MENLLRLDGKTVLVTGAGQGVGRQVARHCAGHGARVVVNDFHLDRADAVAAEIRAAGGSAVASRCDVTDFDDVMDMVARVEQEAGGIDVLVNNAGNAGPVQDPMSPAPRSGRPTPKNGTRGWARISTACLTARAPPCPPWSSAVRAAWSP